MSLPEAVWWVRDRADVGIVLLRGVAPKQVGWSVERGASVVGML